MQEMQNEMIRMMESKLFDYLSAKRQQNDVIFCSSDLSHFLFNLNYVHIANEPKSFTLFLPLSIHHFIFKAYFLHIL